MKMQNGMAAQNSPSDTQFHILSFEGPDGYARAGGIVWERGVSPLVIPNGLTADAFVPPDREAVGALRARLCDRTVLSKWRAGILRN
jgi:hypothetical protein